MAEAKNDWATPSMKEFVFWHDGMTPEEYEIELAYFYGKTATPELKKAYKPICQQDNPEKVVMDDTWASPYMKGFAFWYNGITLAEYKEKYNEYFQNQVD